MTTLLGQPESAAEHHILRRQLREMGMPVLTVAEDGTLLPSEEPGSDWLVDLFQRSPLVQRAIAQAARDWTAQADPAACEGLPGCWLVPLPMVSRRRRTGYAVAVVATDAFASSEQFVAMCQAAQQDLTLAQQKFRELPPATHGEVGRLTSLIQLVHQDHARLATTSAAMDAVGQQLAESYEEINLLYTITQSMTVTQRPERFVNTACQELLETLPYRWIGALMGDDSERLKRLAGRLVVAGEPGHSVEHLRTIAAGLLGEARPDEPIVLEPAWNERHAAFRALGPTALIHPVCRDGRVMGLLIAGDKLGADPAASSVDMKLLGATATHLAIFLENAALYEDLNGMFLGALEALTASIDAKDRYTCGHSRRVALLTRQLARAVGLSDHVIGRMHIAGLVHDVGKIGVPEAVLYKPGTLTADEFAWIRKHPEIGYRILKDIPQLQDILPGVLYHHERWDGRGYPRGLTGGDIPLVARLIALADSFDAMSSTRTYRPARSRESALEEIRRCAGAQFDPELVMVFVTLDFGEYDRLVADHRAIEMQAIEEGAAA
jgi:HD-GYP domain-containing protein (c-di-GMP phosphodiesterase class II)